MKKLEEAENNQNFALLSQSNSLQKANIKKLKLIDEVKKIEADLITRWDSIVSGLLSKGHYIL